VGSGKRALEWKYLNEEEGNSEGYRETWGEREAFCSGIGAKPRFNRLKLHARSNRLEVRVKRAGCRYWEKRY